MSTDAQSMVNGAHGVDMECVTRNVAVECKNERENVIAQHHNLVAAHVKDQHQINAHATLKDAKLTDNGDHMDVTVNVRQAVVVAYKRNSVIVITLLLNMAERTVKVLLRWSVCAI